MQESALTPQGIASAALFAQIAIVAILFVGAGMIRAASNRPFTVSDVGRRPSGSRHGASSFPWWILALAIASLFLLVFSDRLAALWQPAFGDLSLGAIPYPAAIAGVFSLNILTLAVLTSLTRGSRRSEFSPLFFLLPALAIFLREPPQRLFIYTAAVIVAFTLTIRQPRYYASEFPEESPSAFWFVSVASMLVAVLVGYATRPR